MKQNIFVLDDDSGDRNFVRLWLCHFLAWEVSFY